MKKTGWFAPFGWVHYPASWQGWVITLLFVVFLVLTFAAIDLYSHSATDTFFGLFPFWVPAFLLWDWIASRACGRGEKK